MKEQPVLEGADEPRKVLMSPRIFDYIVTRDNEGHRLHVTWGKPDAEGFYEPTVTVDYKDKLCGS